MLIIFLHEKDMTNNHYLTSWIERLVA